jgi:hypothetical protein
MSHIEYKRSGDLSPEEAAQFVTQQTNQIRGQQKMLQRRHEEFTRLHGHTYLRELKLNIEDFFPPEPETADA